MRFWKNWKKAMALGLGAALVFGRAAYAEGVLTPITVVSPGIGASLSEDGAGGTENSMLQEPEVLAEGACLMDAATGRVLYGKNQDQQFYPASITKVMTALLVLERCRLDDMVTFSSMATSNLESGAVSLDISAGDQMTVEQALHGLLLKSANEIGNGLAEHVAGSVDAFAVLMNEKAASLGCKNTHFANPHGLTDQAHKTTPYDMCLILGAALRNDSFRRIDTTLSYAFPAVKNAAARTITMGHKMMYPTDSRYYPGIVGGKTGYTSAAGNTLVTGVERDGICLVAVVMKSKNTHYQDTKAMLDYGFENYAALTGQGSGVPAAPAVAPSAPAATPLAPAATPLAPAATPLAPGGTAPMPSGAVSQQPVFPFAGSPDVSLTAPGQ